MTKTANSDEWQPIETAPKDGTDVILPVSGEAKAFWSKEEKRWVTVRHYEFDYVDWPDRWKPIEPPKEQP